MIDCLIFDVGKVILFFDNSIFFRKLAEYSPYSAQDIFQQVPLYRDLILSFDKGRIGPEGFYAEVVQALEADVGQKKFFRLYNDIFFLNTPVLDLLRRLKAHYKLILLSNTDVERFGFIRKKFPEIFLFDAYVLSYEVGHMKPHPEIYEEALNKAQVPAQQCVFIDDLPENIEGARSMGMSVILYGPHIDLEAELIKLNVTI